MIIVERTYDYYLDRLSRGETFSFSRWCDGEWIALLGDDPEGANCDGHRYFPDMCDALRDILRSEPCYYMTTSIRACEIFQPRLDGWLREHRGPRVWHEEGIFSWASQRGRLGPLFETLKRLPVVVVGPPHLARVDQYFSYERFVELPEQNCFLALEDILAAVRMAHIELPKPFVVSLCAGMASEIIIDRLYAEMHDDAFLIDFGSLFDPYVGVISRSSHRRIAAINGLPIQSQTPEITIS